MTHTSAENPVRIGAVAYLNTKPLVYRLREIAPHAELLFDLPSRLADGLAKGQFDVALIPSVEFFRNSDYMIVSNACIACRGPVLSVKLFSKLPAAKIRTLSLDEGSRTSAALVQILLQAQYGLRPQIENLPIGATLADADADAVLLIGDRAIQSPPGRFAEVWDLGDRWHAWSGLPFVFAMWVARKDANLQGIGAALQEARDEGVGNVRQIAEIEAAGYGLTTPQCLAYLRDNLHFYLAREELNGLRMFYEKSCELGLAPAGIDTSGWSLGND